MVFISDTGYHITKVTVNGKNITSVQPGIKTYTYPSISSVTSNNNVIVTTEEEGVTVKYIAKSGGTVALQGTSDYSSNKSEKVKPSSGNPEGAIAKANLGYKFKGWSTDPNGTSGFITTQNIKLSKQNNVYSDATYYAFFEESDSVVITYRAAQPSMGQVPSNQNKEKVEPVTGIPKGALAEAKAGYEFLYWTLGPTAGENGENIVSYSANFVPTKGVDEVWTTRTYYAHFQEKTVVTIKYQSSDVNTGTVSPTSESLSPVSGIAKGSTAIANPGYEFVNWTLNVAVVSTEPHFVPNKPEGSLWTSSTYIANFKELDKVTITYEAESNGSVSSTSDVLNPEIGIPKGSTATANAGYEFAGWYVGEKKVSDEAELTKEIIDTNAKSNGAYVATTFIAKFAEKSKVTITYEAESNGSVSSTSDVINPEIGIAKGSTAMANAGYEFAGWYVGENKVSDEAELTKEVIDTNAKSNGAYVATTFIAKFVEKEKVAITYEAEPNGSVSSTSDVINPEIGIAKGSTAIANAGYEFAGWYVGENKVSDVAELKKETIDANAKSNGVYVATTFIAKFAEKSKVTITYEAEENGSVSSTSDVLNPEIGTPKGSTAMANAGYEFAGWYVGENKVSDVAELKKETIDANAKSNGAYVATTFIAKFNELASITINYKSENTTMGKVSLDEELLLPATGVAKGSTAIANTGYTFIGWYNSEEVKVSSNVTFVPSKVNNLNVSEIYTAKFTVNVHKLIDEHVYRDINGNKVDSLSSLNQKDYDFNSPFTIDANEDTRDYDLSEIEIYLNNTKLDKTSIEEAGIVITESGNVSGNIPDAQIWIKYLYNEVPKYTVTYTSEGSPTDMPSEITERIAEDEIIISTTEPKRIGYRFGGWYPVDIKVIVTDGKFIMPDSDVELRAKWAPTEEVYNYKVQYYKDGKMFTEDSATVLKIDSSVTSVIDRTPTGYKLQGYVFNNGEMSKTLNVEITEDNQIIKVYYEKFDLIVKHIYGTQTVFDTNQSKITLDEDIIKVNAVYSGRYKKVTSISINDVSQKVATSVEISVLDNEKYEVVFSYKRNSSDDGGTGGGGSTGGGDTGEDVTVVEDPQVALEDSLEKINHFAYIFGYEDGTVKPNNFITREEVASIFYRLLNDEAREEHFIKNQKFPDVSSSRWSNYAIATLLNGKIISGYPEDGLFKPDNPITRAEFASIVSRFDSLSYYGDDKFADIKGHWSNKFVNAASEKGWIKGYPDGSFKPQNFITRAEAVTLINNVLNRKVDKKGIHKDSKFWTDNNQSDWYYEAISEATNSHDYKRNDATEAEKWTSINENKTWKER